MPAFPSEGDLARIKSHEADSSWPSHIEITAIWSKDGSRRGKRKSIEINADEFFGIGRHGAPMSGDRIIQIINDLRRK
jgi:hypothetical protein